MEPSLHTPLEEFHHILTRLRTQLLADHAHFSEYRSIKPRTSPGLFCFDDEVFSDVTIRKFPSSTTSERWLIIGSDWDDFSPFQSEEKGHLHISPSAPEWTGLVSLEDFYAYRSIFMGGAPSSVSWFENGIWHVSRERMKQWDTIDPHKPWTDESMSWAFNSFLSDDALLELMGSRFSRGGGDNSTQEELKQRGLMLKAAIENTDSDAFVDYVRNMHSERAPEPFSTEEEEGLRNHHKEFHAFQSGADH